MCILKLSDPNHLYVPTKVDILNILNAIKVYGSPNVLCSQAHEVMATLFTFLEQYRCVSELRTMLLFFLEKSNTTSQIQESCQTTIDSYFGH